MSDSTLLSKVKTVLADVFQVPEEDLSDDLVFGDLPQWDSMGHMDVMLSLEQNFGVEINAETIGSLTSLATICAYLEQNGNA
jgi:acyl carrier protein